MARTLLVCACVCLALALPSPAAAQASRTKKYPLDISRQELTRALEQLNHQTGLYYLYLPASSEEELILVGPLKGKYQVDKALTDLLRPTELTFEWTGAKTVSIVRRPPAPKPPPVPPKQPRAALVPKPVPTQASADDRIIDWVVSVGRSPFRSLPGPTAAGFVIDAEAIGRSGVTTVMELLRLLPQQPFLRPDGFRSNGAQYAELRGLGPDTTLVMINGRRAFASAASFTVNAFDLNQLPLSAVERVEVQLDSISVRHGADAIGGIVNVVMRDEVHYPSFEVRYGAAAGGGEQRQASFSAGYHSEDVKSALILDYLDVSPLLGAERDLWNNQNYQRFGGADLRSTVSSPLNIVGTVPPVFPPLIAGIPEHTAGLITQPGEFRPFDLNRESLLRYFPIVTADRRASAVASVEANVTPTLIAGAELLAVDRRVVFESVPPVVAGAIVPNTNPYNSLGQSVLVIGLLEGVDRTQAAVDSLLVRGSGSLRGKIKNLEWDLSLTRSEEDAEARIDNVVDPVRLALALNDSDLSRTLNLLGPGPAASPAVLASVLAPTQINTFGTDATQLMGALTGKPFALPAGGVKMILGTEWRKEAVQFDSLLGAFGREVAVGFAELEIPLVGQSIQLPAARELTLTLAGRLDRYTDFGEIFSPQFGLVWRPFRDVAVRATHGRSFRPPSLYDLHLPRELELIPTLLADPRRGDAYNMAQLAGGSRELEATRGESFAAQIEFTPESLAPLKLSTTYWQVDMSDRVITMNPAFVLAHESLLPGRVVRADPTAQDVAAGIPGRVLHVDVSRMNFGHLTTSGIDAGASYGFESKMGHFAADVKATWIDKYEALDLPGEPSADRVNVAHSLGTIAKWRAITSLDWRRGPLNATTYVRYIPSYDDTREGVRTGRKIPSQTFLDLQFSLDVGELMDRSRLLRGVGFSAGALNVFDKLPHFAEVGGVLGYDNSQGDLKGRFWYLRLGKTF